MGFGLPERLGIVVGLEAEARIARRLTRPELVAVSGATAAGARRALDTLLAAGVDALMSFGLAAGLDPALEAGALLVPRTVVVRTHTYGVDPRIATAFPRADHRPMWHSDDLIAKPVEKKQLFLASGCIGLDMESGLVAEASCRARLPFMVLRAISDRANQALPPAATIPLRPDGTVRLRPVVASVLCRPYQLPPLLRLARGTNAALRSLSEAVTILGR